MPLNDDGFHTCRQGGDTLDAFAPLTHRGEKPQTADHPAQWVQIAGAFTHIHGPDYRWEKVKERVYVHESVSLMHVKPVDPRK